MSEVNRTIKHTIKHKGVGVSGYGPPMAVYSPNKHNRPTPLRMGSQDAFKCPSIDFAGNTRPYWGISNELP